MFNWLYSVFRANIRSLRTTGFYRYSKPSKVESKPLSRIKYINGLQRKTNWNPYRSPAEFRIVFPWIFIKFPSLKKYLEVRWKPTRLVSERSFFTKFAVKNNLLWNDLLFILVEESYLLIQFLIYLVYMISMKI